MTAVVTTIVANLNKLKRRLHVDTFLLLLFFVVGLNSRTANKRINLPYVIPRDPLGLDITGVGDQG